MVFVGRVLTTKQDNYNTPDYAWRDILQYFDKETKIWCPFYNDGTLLNILSGLGYNDVHHKNVDYFTYEKPDRILIDNPPYSIKQKIIERSYKHKTALLLPLDTLERKYFKNYIENFQLIVPNIRYSYTNGKGTIPFKSCWFCWNLQEELGTNKNMIFI